jgi:kynureninase
MTRNDCLALDADDPLAPLRRHFALDRVDRDGIV